VKVSVIVVGRVRGPLAEVVKEYEERAARYWKLEVMEVAGGSSRGNATPDDGMAAEGERLLARVPDGAELILLDRAGKAMGSRDLARLLNQHALHGSPGVSFLVGGAHGVAPEVRSRARRTLSISAMTFPHEVARLLLAEQLYRAGTIVRGEPYHKGS